jgi:hypothetical protein
MFKTEKEARRLYDRAHQLSKLLWEAEVREEVAEREAPKLAREAGVHDQGEPRVIVRRVIDAMRQFLPAEVF